MKKQLVLFLALALCLGLTACGDTESDDTQSGYETVMDMEFLDGMWSIDGTAKLYFDSTEGFYAYRTRWGLGGRGEFELSEASGRPMIFFNGLLYNFLLRDDGVLLPNRNGEGSGLTILTDMVIGKVGGILRELCVDGVKVLDRVAALAARQG